MKFDLISFGNKLHNIRKELNLTIEEVSFLSNVNEKTIYRIEHGKNQVSLATLEKLSIPYKRNLISLYNEFNDNPKEKLYLIINDTEQKLYNDDNKGILDNIEELKKLSIGYLSSYEQLYLKYYLSLLDATIVDIQYNNRIESIKLLTKIIKSNIYGFEVLNYKAFNYSEIEARILMNLSTMAYNLYKSKTSLEILSFILPILIDDRILFPKVILNLSTIHYLKDDYDKSSSLIDKGIGYCINNRNFEALSKLYFRKFTVELKLDNSNYINSLNKSIFLAEINKQHSNIIRFKESANKIYGVKI